MPQDKYYRPNADKLNAEGADVRPYGVGPTRREMRFQEMAETIGAPKSKFFPPLDRKEAIKRASSAAKTNASNYGTPTQRLQREMAAGTRKSQEQAEFDRDTKRMAPRIMQIEMDDAKKQAEDRAYYDNKNREKNAKYGQTALSGRQGKNVPSDDLSRLKEANKLVKEYTKEGKVDPDVRKYQKSYYRGDQGMKPRDPDESNPNDQQLRDLYEGSGKYYGFGKTALGGTQSNSVSKDDRYRRGMNIKK